jgi:hypothetical protein
MPKTDKAIPEEVAIEDAPAVIQELAAAQPEETFEEREARLKREDYQRRNLQAIKDREEIMRRNGVLSADEPFSMDADAAVRARCCL